MPVPYCRPISILLRGARSASGGAPFDPTQRRREIVKKRQVRALCRARAGDQHIVRAGTSLIRQDPRRRRAQPSFRPVADHRVAYLSARGESDPRRGVRRRVQPPRRRLQDQTRGYGPSTARRDTKEIGSNFEGCKPSRHGFTARQARAAKDRASGGQSLAALRSPGREDASAGGGCHPRPEPVAALANEVAGLVSALHGTGSDLRALIRAKAAV
jgi:hypothetical protein